MAESTKPKASSPATTTPASDPAPLNPSFLQVGETVSAPLTTNPPRGVDELPSNQIADEPAAAELQKHVQEIVDKEQAQGYRGDPNKNRTPNTAYTLAGVSRGDATPETNVYTPTSK